MSDCTVLHCIVNITSLFFGGEGGGGGGGVGCS